MADSLLFLNRKEVHGLSKYKIQKESLAMDQGWPAVVRSYELGFYGRCPGHSAWELEEGNLW